MTPIRTAEQAAEVARATTTNAEGMCQQVTRGYYLAPGAGDRDGDGDADAYDGWLSEPVSARVPDDRKPPLGFPVSFRSKDRSKHGHRAISLGDANGDGVYLIRSTDFDTATKSYRAGVVGTGTIAEVAAAMRCDYLGWSKTIDGVPIQSAAAKPAAKPEVAPLAHRHVVNTWNDTRELSLLDVSAVQRTGKQPYAAAADQLHDAVQAAVDKYYRATGEKK